MRQKPISRVSGSNPMKNFFKQFFFIFPFQCFCAMTLFYCAHWQTYVSGTLRFGKVDVTEAQVTIMIIQMISAIFGSNIWTTKVTFQGSRVNPFQRENLLKGDD